MAVKLVDTEEPSTPEFEITPLSVELMARHMILGDASLIIMSGFPQEGADPVSHLDHNVVLERDAHSYQFSQAINFDKTRVDSRNLATEIEEVATGKNIRDGVINVEHPLVDLERRCERGRKRIQDKQQKWAFALGTASKQNHIALEISGHAKIGRDHRGESLFVHIEVPDSLAQELCAVLASDEPINTEVQSDRHGEFPIYPRDLFLYHLLTTSDAQEVMPTRRTPNLTNTPDTEEARYAFLGELRNNYRVDRNLRRAGKENLIIDSIAESIKQYAADEHPINIEVQSLFDVGAIVENAKLVVSGN